MKLGKREIIYMQCSLLCHIYDAKPSAERKSRADVGQHNTVPGCKIILDDA